MKWKLFALFLILLALTACGQPADEGLISEAGSFSETFCSENALEGQYVMIGSAYCSHCVETKPVFEEACTESGTNCVVLDISTTEGTDAMNNLGISVMYTPTFIFDCDYFVGALDKEGYLELLAS